MTQLCTFEGAQEIKRRIREHWKKQGYDVELTAEPLNYIEGQNSIVWIVRSDMVNGYPKDWRRRDANYH